ncbi:MAG: hypothetical protein ACK5F0_07025 [Flavobacteriales bacterium]|jgi:hypothetical protein
MDKLDDIFKKAIESHTEPYDPTAWEALEKRLDSQLPPKTNPFKKWGLPGAALVIGISFATWYFTDSSTPVSAPISPKTATIKQHKTEVKTHVNHSKKKEKQPEIAMHGEYLEPLPEWKESTIIDTESEPVFNQLQNVSSTIDELPSNTLELLDNPKPKELFTYNPLVLPTCAGVPSELKNTNGFEITLKSNNLLLSIEPNSSLKLELSAGTIEIIDPKTGVILQSNVIAGPKGDLVMDEMIYENGLPVQGIHVKTEATVRSIRYGKQIKENTGKDLNLHLFDKGTTLVHIDLTDDNGCTNEISGLINVAEDYNLLAVNAFEPTSQDARKTTFMPYALTQRATPFRMIIIDPNDGGIVFESTDATLPWDGIDRRYGKMGDSNKAYVWKVTLSEPKAGEKSEYMGTVVRM